MINNQCDANPVGLDILKVLQNCSDFFASFFVIFFNFALVIALSASCNFCSENNTFQKKNYLFLHQQLSFGELVGGKIDFRHCQALSLSFLFLFLYLWERERADTLYHTTHHRKLFKDLGVDLYSNVIQHWNRQLKHNSFPLRKNRVN